MQQVERVAFTTTRRQKAATLLLLALLTGGLALQWAFGEFFLPTYRMFPGATVLLMLLPSWALVAWLSGGRPISPRVPDWVLRPVFVLLLACVFALGARGWVAGGSRLVADRPAEIDVLVLDNVTQEGTRGSRCAQELTISHRDAEYPMCADRLKPDHTIRAGATLRVGTRISPLGAHVVSIERK